jgi:hypothetical protein
MLFDLENPINGLYSFKKSLDARLVYVSVSSECFNKKGHPACWLSYAWLVWEVFQTRGDQVLMLATASQRP